MISPDQAFRMRGSRVYELQCALKVIKQGSIGFIFQVAQEAVVKTLGFAGVPLAVKQNERFPKLHVLGLVLLDLPKHHYTTEYEERQKHQDEFVPTHKTHGCFLSDACLIRKKIAGCTGQSFLALN
jgi:hypothetical protein